MKTPKNPLFAEKGEGCGDSNIRAFLLLIKSFFILALFPHNINTIGLSEFPNNSIILSVKICQPILE